MRTIAWFRLIGLLRVIAWFRLVALRWGVERGDFWAGAAHPRRQKHREMPPPGASAPAFVATVEPALTQMVSSASSACDGTRAGGCAEDETLPASILDFRPELGNRCRVLPVYALMRASILDFKPRLANRCKVFPVYGHLRASILDFKLELGNRCKVFPVYCHLHASILDFRPRLANRCSIIVVTVENGPPATAVAATTFRVRY